MDDQNSEIPEVTPPDQTQKDESHVDESVSQDEGQVEDKQEKNWRELRKKADKAELYESKLNDYERRMQMHEELLKQMIASKQPAPVEEVDEISKLAPDDYPNIEQAVKIAEKKGREAARNEYAIIQKQQDRKNFRDRLQKRYTDFETVVNDSSIAEFEKREPELASKIAAKDDPYEMGQDTYMYIKAMGIYQKEDRHSKEVADKIEQKNKTVQSPQVYEKRPMAQAFEVGNMSPDEKQKMYQEMMGYASMTSGY